MHQAEYKALWWLDPSQQLRSMQLLTHSAHPTAGQRREQEEQKREHSWVKIEANKWRKEEKKPRSFARAITDHLPRANRCPTNLWATATLEDTSPARFFFLYSSFYCWAQRYIARNITLANSSQLSRQCPLPAPCQHQPTHCGEQSDKQRKPKRCACIA